jgi:peptide/nickel transport system permease protein
MRVSLATAVAATAVALGLGLLVGLACGAWRGFVDLALMRVVEVFLCFPQLFLVLVVFAYLPHGRTTLALLLGVVGWTTTAQIAPRRVPAAARRGVRRGGARSAFRRGARAAPPAAERARAAGGRGDLRRRGRAARRVR